MAVNVLRRPGGYNLSGSSLAIIVYNSSVISDANNRAVVYHPTHGFTNNQVVYLKTTSQPYNGFKRIRTSGSINYYYIIEDQEDITYIPFVSQVNGTEYNITTFGFSNGWNCLHLPIIYKTSNTRWPLNSVDTLRTISSVTDSNGYCDITSSGAMTSAVATIAALDSVIISNATDDDLNGVWQCISSASDTSFVINIPYSAANDTALTGASIHFYYNNYVTKVQVWGGLNNGHTYYAQKPYELLATLDLIPDDDNICTFSISEVLKKQIFLRNNLLLGTLPNNLDAWTGFFIKYGEEFDQSDGTTLTRSTVSYTSDIASFEGQAMNSMLPFKNVYSGAMSEYVSGDANQKFLTNWVIPTIFPGWYFDIGYIFSETTDGLLFVSKWYLGGVLQLTEISELIDPTEAVIRYSIEGNCDYDRLDLTAYTATETAMTVPTSWTDNVAWTSKSSTQFSYIDAAAPYGSPPESYFTLDVAIGDIIIVDFEVSLSGTYDNTLLIDTAITDGPNTNISNPSINELEISSGETLTFRTVITATATVVGARFNIIVIPNPVATGSITLTVTPATVYYHTAIATDARSVTKTININCDCVPTQSEEGIYLSWQNNLGDFDYWLFTANKDHIIDITDSGETEENIFPDWPNSYGEFADTANRRQTFRVSTKQILVRSQNLSADDLEMIMAIKSSPLVQIVNSIYDRRTVIVDTDSFVWKQEGQNQKDPYKISFTITYTDDVASQKV